MSDAFEAALAAAKEGAPSQDEAAPTTPEETAAEQVETTGETQTESGPTLDEVKQLLADGKLRELAKRFSVDADKLDVHPAKLRKLNKTRDELTAREAKLEQNRGEVARAQAELVTKQNRVSRLESIENAIQAGDWSGVARAVESVLPDGMDFAQLTYALSQGGKPQVTTDPKLVRELEEVKRKLAEREENERKQQGQSHAERDRQHVREQLAKHDLSKLDGFEDQVRAEMDRVWNPKLQTWSKTLKEVADELLKKETERASKLLGVKSGPKKAPAARTSVDERFAVPASKGEDPRDRAFKAALAQAEREARAR